LYGHGVYQWVNDLYVVCGNQFFKNGTVIGTVQETIPSIYRFAVTMGSPNRLFFANGSAAYTYDTTNGLVQVTDANYPATTVEGVAYLDGTMYVMDPSGNIRGSNINDAQTWPALNTIQANINPEAAMCLIKQLTYVVAIKKISTEFFFDGGNPVGSPLTANTGSKLNIGTVASGSVCEIDGDFIWLARGESGWLHFVRMSNLQHTTISTTAVEKILNDTNVSQNATQYSFYSFDVAHGGHTFYVFTWPDVSAGYTLVYDLKEKLWYQWSEGGLPYFPYIASVHTPFGGGTLLQHETNGHLYLIDSKLTTDKNAPITVDVYTPNFDAGVGRRKMLTSMRFVGDQNVGSTLQVRANDNDYDATKWTNFRQVDLSQQNPQLRNCGTFYRRAYHFRHQSNTPFRLKAIDLQLDVGTL
jgi:hypothetical protein